MIVTFQKKVTIRVGQPASHKGAWWRAIEHGIRSIAAAEEGSYLVHLTGVPNNFMPTASGACRSRSVGEHGAVHDERAVVDALLRLNEVLQRRSSTLHRVAHAHRQQLNAASATTCAAQQAWPQSSIPRPISKVQGTEKNSAGELHGCAWMGEASWGDTLKQRSTEVDGVQPRVASEVSLRTVACF